MTVGNELDQPLIFADRGGRLLLAIDVLSEKVDDAADPFGAHFFRHSDRLGGTFSGNETLGEETEQLHTATFSLINGPWRNSETYSAPPALESVPDMLNPPKG